MGDREWLIPGTAVTVLAGAIAIALIPSYSGIMPAVGILPIWILAAIILGSMYGFFVMVIAQVDSPAKAIRSFIFEDRRAFAVLVFGIVIAGLNMTTFMWTKPLLNYHIPFWADPLLADLDYWLFLGNDPWVFLTRLNTSAMAIFYHRGWIGMIILSLVIVLTAQPSPKKSAIMLTYFLCWSVIGPVLHILLPATGPIFYADMGYGDRFAGLQNVSETSDVAAYLWAIYAERGFGAGAGISAMPSLHITTTVWMMIAVHAFAKRLIVPMTLAGLLIFLLSIALGWHYAVDGIIGGAAAWLCYKGLLAFYSRAPRNTAAPALATE